MEENVLFDGKTFRPTNNEFIPEEIKNFGCDNGVYLETIELQNWGPFSGITEIPLGGYPALLVGENGTGKSSLMDAILTLLVSSGLRYNNASDNHGNKADERTLSEYILGVAGSNLSEDETGIKKKIRYLRQTGEISIILLRFRTGIDFLTIANVFLIEEGRKDPQRFYVFAKRPLSIRTDFAVTSRSFEGYRSAIGQLKNVTVTTDRSKYFQFVRSEVGLINDNAMRLLRSLSSMKNLPKPNEFIRKHMLPGRTDYKTVFQEMKKGMEEVNEIGLRLSNERKRFTMLDSMAEVLQEAISLRKEKELWSHLGEKVRPFVYEHGKESAQREINSFKEKKSVLDGKILRLDNKRTEYISSKATLTMERDMAGGTAIIQKKAALSGLLDEKVRKQSVLDRFMNAISFLGFTDTIGTEHRLKSIQKDIIKKKKEISSLYQEKIIARDEAKKALDVADIKHRDLRGQLMRLEKDRTSIDERLVAVRDEVCQTLGVDSETMPFLGNYLSVKEGEEEWRPALEHLFYNMSISFLVPEELLTKVSGYLRSHRRSGVHIRYIAMKPVAKSPRLSGSHPPCAWSKISVRQNLPYTSWVEDYIRYFGGNYCCDTPEEFVKEYPAIMKDGQIRGNLYVIRKNEAIDIFDPKNFVMSGSFEERKKAISKSVTDAEGEFFKARSYFGQTAGAVKKLESEIELFENIPFVSSFSEIDVATVEDAIKDLEKSISVLSADAKLEAVEDRIAKVEKELLSVEESIKTVREEAESIVGKIGSLLDQTSSYEKLLTETVISSNEQKILNELYVKYAPDSVNPKFDSVMSVAPKMMSQITRKLSEITETCDRRCHEAENRMHAYLDEFKSRRADLVADISLPGEAEKFIAERNMVRDNFLPEAIKAFEEIRDFGKFDPLRRFVVIMTAGVEQEIKKAVEDVNRALLKVPYSQGTDPTFLQINCLHNREGDVVRLRKMLSDLANSGALSSLNDVSNEKAEEITLQARELIEFLEPRIIRGYSQGNILDPRTWYMFPVSVCREVVSEDGETEIVHVKELDEANKQSSGESEKFTYFILAACFAIWMHLFDEDYTGHTLRFLTIDEIGNKLTSSNLRDVIFLFRLLHIQLVSILPHGDKVSEYENFVANIIQTDWLDKPAGISFVDTISLTEYAKRNREYTEALLEKGRRIKNNSM